MAKKTFNCSQVALDHAAMVALRTSGKLNLGIDDAVAAHIVTSKLKPRKTTAASANFFWNVVAIVSIVTGIYWSFTDAWWWFLPGLVLGIVIWRANSSANSSNLLDAAMIDREFYERVRSRNGWLYQIEEDEAARLVRRPS